MCVCVRESERENERERERMQSRTGTETGTGTLGVSSSRTYVVGHSAVTVIDRTYFSTEIFTRLRGRQREKKV